MLDYASSMKWILFKPAVKRARCFSVSIHDPTLINRAVSNKLKKTSKRIVEKSGNSTNRQNSSNILNILHNNTICNEIKYLDAIKRLGSIGDIQCAKKVINDVINFRPILPSLRIYNQLFNAFAWNDCIWESQFYIDSMINVEGIMPNIETATILIKGCKRKGMVKFAEKIWKDMITNYHLKPNINTYSQMMGVYGIAGKHILAEKLFKEMTECQHIEANIVVCSYLMKAYAENKDTPKVLKMKQYIESKHMKLTHVQYLIIMTCYLKNDDYHNALNIYDEYVNVCVTKHIKMFALQMVAYIGIMSVESSNNIEKRKYYFDLITNSIQLNWKYLNITLANIQLFATIIFYENDFDEILNIFNKLQSENMFGYWTKDYLSIDLHEFGYDVAQFILLYIFKFEKQRILSMSCVQVLVGRGTHKDRKSALLGNSNKCKGIRECIARELMNYSPPIRSDNYKAFLILNRDDILKYYQQ